MHPEIKRSVGLLARAPVVPVVVLVAPPLLRWIIDRVGDVAVIARVTTNVPSRSGALLCGDGPARAPRAVVAIHGPIVAVYKGRKWGKRVKRRKRRRRRRRKRRRRKGVCEHDVMRAVEHSRGEQRGSLTWTTARVQLATAVNRRRVHRCRHV